VAGFEVTTRLASPAERVFDLSLDVEVHTGSMARSGERAVAGVTSGRLGLGDTVTWSARHFGLPWRMTSRITEWDRPRLFVDEQVSGPFRHWRHLHQFAPTPGGGTSMRDVVEFSAPLGPLGAVTTHILLRRYLRHLIEVRNRHLIAVAGDHTE
jgi:ligand-binding SRPBCC domain-containing protein